MSVLPATSVPNILICDDDATTRFLLKRVLLRELKANVTEACDGLEALRLLKANPCDLLVLDLRMPVMDGPETLETVRKTPELRDLSVIVLSGANDADIVKRVIDAGVSDFLLKPLARTGTQERLMRIIATLRNRAAANTIAAKADGQLDADKTLARLIERVPDLRATLLGATEQAFGMMVKMDVEPLPDPQPPIATPSIAGRVSLTVGDELEVDIELTCTEESASVFAVAIFGGPKPSDVLGELANIVAGRVRHAMITQNLPTKQGLPTVETVQTPGAASGGAKLASRFGVIGTPHQLDVALRVAERAQSAVAAAS